MGTTHVLSDLVERRARLGCRERRPRRVREQTHRGSASAGLVGLHQRAQHHARFSPMTFSRNESAPAGRTRRATRARPEFRVLGSRVQVIAELPQRERPPRQVRSPAAEGRSRPPTSVATIRRSVAFARGSASQSASIKPRHPAGVRAAPLTPHRRLRLDPRSASNVPFLERGGGRAIPERLMLATPVRAGR